MEIRIWRKETLLETADHCVKTGQLVFAFSEANEVTAIFVTGLTEKDIAHINFELQNS